jgi:hypothetical protein
MIALLALVAERIPRPNSKYFVVRHDCLPAAWNYLHHPLAICFFGISAVWEGSILGADSTSGLYACAQRFAPRPPICQGLRQQPKCRQRC